MCRRFLARYKEKGYMLECIRYLYDFVAAIFTAATATLFQHG
jgi:hypothetical protein